LIQFQILLTYTAEQTEHDILPLPRSSSCSLLLYYLLSRASPHSYYLSLKFIGLWPSLPSRQATPSLSSALIFPLQYSIHAEAGKRSVPLGSIILSAESRRSPFAHTFPKRTDRDSPLFSGWEMRPRGGFSPPLEVDSLKVSEKAMDTTVSESR
jgi:hypothetical protein